MNSSILRELGYWVINEIFHKSNPTPNFENKIE